MKFLQNLLRIEPILRRMGMTLSGDAAHVSVMAGETLITLTRTNGKSYLISSLMPYQEPKELQTLEEPTSEELLSAIQEAR